MKTKTKPLSPREAQVLEMIRRGASRQQIARSLDCSIPYVREVTKSLRVKLGGDSVEDLRK
jgi:DNA-binding CsgD family transcriptional regulator